MFLFVSYRHIPDVNILWEADKIVETAQAPVPKNYWWQSNAASLRTSDATRKKMTPGRFRRPLRNQYGSFANKLPVGQRYHLIKSHFVSSINYKFPTLSNAIASSVVYSPSVDGVFCKHCALMIPMQCRKNKGAFVNKPFINWHKLQEKAKRHIKQMKYYHDAMIATESFLNSVENPEWTTD